MGTNSMEICIKKSPCQYYKSPREPSHRGSFFFRRAPVDKKKLKKLSPGRDINSHSVRSFFIPLFNPPSPPPSPSSSILLLFLYLPPSLYVTYL